VSSRSHFALRVGRDSGGRLPGAPAFTNRDFRRLYNDERPHEALHDRTPASLYRPSRREYSGTLPPVEYPGHFIVKRVTNAGTIRLRRRLLFFANALKQHPVGLEEIDDGVWSIHFCRVLLGRVDERDYIIRT
jgi:putative transposase